MDSGESQDKDMMTYADGCDSGGGNDDEYILENARRHFLSGGYGVLGWKKAQKRDGGKAGRGGLNVVRAEKIF